MSSSDTSTQALHRLVTVLSEDAIFALSAGSGDPEGTLAGLSKRRAEAYSATVQGAVLPTMTEQPEAWQVHLTRALAPIAPPVGLPMMELIREKVTLEVGARGLRSLFSTKPSEKDAQRVKKLGSLAVRTLRSVLLADGELDAEELLTIACVLGALGLSDAEAVSLYNEAPLAARDLEVYGEVEPAVARAVVRGAWLAAALDTVDPREEEVVRSMAQKLGVPEEDTEAARAEALARVESRRLVGVAAIDAVRVVLGDSVPGAAVTLAARVASLLVPRRYRDEVLGHVGHGTPVVLAKRHEKLPLEDKVTALGVAWATALVEDPTLGRRALLRARWERVLADVGEEAGRARVLVDDFVGEALAAAARTLR